MDSKVCAHLVSDGKEDSTRNWARGHLFYIPAKNLATLCPCPKALCEAEFKGDILVWQRKFQSSIDSIGRQAAFYQIYSKNQNENQKDLKNFQFSWKRSACKNRAEKRCGCRRYQ